VLDSISVVCGADLQSKREPLLRQRIRAANTDGIAEGKFYADHIDSRMSIGMIRSHGTISGLRALGAGLRFVWRLQSDLETKALGRFLR